MIDSLSRPLLAAAQSLLSDKSLGRDDESRLAATLRMSVPADEAIADDESNGAAAQIVNPIDPKLRRIAAEIVRKVDARLPGRIRGLEVRVENGQFVLAGVSSSYYVKQVAQHLAMNALDARMLGRLVNEIQVRPVR